MRDTSNGLTVRDWLVDRLADAIARHALDTHTTAEIASWAGWETPLDRAHAEILDDLRARVSMHAAPIPTASPEA